MNSANTGEPKAMIQSIRAAEEIYKAEMLTYLSASTTTWYPSGAATGAGSTDSGCPSSPNQRWNWTNPAHTDYANWRQLSIVADAPVRFGYLVFAGASNTAATTVTTYFGSAMGSPPAMGTPVSPWYVVMAQADRDCNGTYAMFVGSSLQGQEIYSEMEGE